MHNTCTQCRSNSHDDPSGRTANAHTYLASEKVEDSVLSPDSSHVLLRILLMTKVASLIATPGQLVKWPTDIKLKVLSNH